MNAHVRLTVFRTAIIAAITATAWGVITWIMRARFDATVLPIKEIRPSAWTVLGVASMAAPFLLLAMFGLAWWYNRPGSARADNRTSRTVGLILAVAGLMTALTVIVANDPLADANSSIFWRGVLSGVIGGAAFLLCEWVMIDLLRRSADRLRRCEALLELWHGAGAGHPANDWERSLPA